MSEPAELEVALRDSERRLARLEVRLDQIDSGGTREVGVLEERLRQLQEDLAGHLDATRGYAAMEERLQQLSEELHEHITSQAEDEAARTQLARWRVTSLVGIIGLLIALLSLVFHVVGLY